MSAFQVGGSLSGDAPSYVRRQADKQLYQALRRREFCYVLNSRQMGKSSLLVQVRSRLHRLGGRCAALDLTSLGSKDVTAERWYQGIGAELCLNFDLLDTQSFLAWWQAQASLPSVQKLSWLIEQVLLPAYPQTPLYVFIDEVDSVLSLPFSADDLFALIRACYNRRALDARFQWLTFAIAGVATPSVLIADKSRTPFNIGYGIELTGFRSEEVEPLIAALQPAACNAPALMVAILQWTNGQPLLTQKLCQLVWDFHTTHLDSEPIPAGTETDWVNGLVHDRILHNWEAQDEPEHLRSIRDRILRSDQRAGRLLGLYQKILNSQSVPSSDSSEQIELLLSGLVIRKNAQLHTKNKIYGIVFDQDWVTQKLAQLRPYGNNLTAWLTSGQADESRLLQGQALQDAQRWAAGKSLDDQDYRYLVASAALDRRVVQQQLEAARAGEAEARLQQERRATKLQRTLLGVVSFALLITAGLSLTTFWQYRQAVKQEQQAEQETIRTLATSAKALLASDQQLDALVAAVRAKYRFARLNASSDRSLETLQMQVITVLRQTLLNAIEVNRLSSHTSVVNDIAFSPDGRMLATVSPDKTLKLWQPDGTLVRTVEAITDDLYAVDFSGDGQQMAIATGNSRVEIWTVKGERVRSLEGHGATVWFVTYDPQGELIASASQDATVRLWSDDGALLQVFKGHTGPVYGADVSPDQRLVASASTDGTAKIWRRDGTAQTTLAGHEGAVWAVAFSPTQDLIATTGQDQTVRLWKTDGTPIKTLTGHSGGIWGVTFSPDGTFLVSTSIDGTARVWSTEGTLLETLTGHEDTVWGVDVSPDGQTIATASWDQTARLWMRSHPLQQTIYSPSDSVTDIAYDATGARFASANLDGAIQLWSRTGKLIKTVGRHGVEAWAVAISPDGTYLVSGSADNTARVWSLNGTLLHTLTGHKDAVYGVDISADSETIATSSINGIVKLWHRDGALKRTVDTEQASPAGIEFSPDGQTIATIGIENSLRIWTVTGQLMHSVEDGNINTVTFSPDGQMLATISDTSVDLRRVNGDLLRQLPLAPEESTSLTDVDFSPDSSLVASTQWNSRLKNWQIKLWRTDGTEVTTLFGSKENIDTIAFSPDGSILASGSFGKTITLWNLEQLLDLDEMTLACDWIGGYLRNSPEVDDEGRSLCKM